MKFCSFFLFAVLLWTMPSAVAGQVLAQDQSELRVLVFEHLQKGKKKLISQGAVIRYKLKSEPKIWRKGLLESIDKEHMTVAGQQVRYADCLLIAGRVHTDRALLGGLALGAGSTTLLVGAAALGSGALGVGLLSGGAVVMVAGILLVTRYQRFHLQKSWSVSAGRLTYGPGY